MSGTFKFLFLLALCTFINCSGPSSEQGPKINADGSLGQKPRDFFRVESSTKITVIRVVDRTLAQKLYFDGSATLVDLGSLSMDKVKFSADAKFITLVGEPGVYEYQNVVAEALATPGVTVGTSTLDSLCITNSNQSVQFGSATFRELQIYSKGSGYQLKIVVLNSSEILGGEAAVATKQASGSLVEYTLAGFGRLSVYLDSPRPEDVSYFNTSIPGLQCRNTDPYAQSTKVMVSTLASFESSGNWAGWFDEHNAKTNDGLSALASVSGLYNPSSPLVLTAYFSEPSYALPLSAAIEGVTVSCEWSHAGVGELGKAYVTDLRLVGSFVTSGDNKGAPVGSPQQISMENGMSQNFGGASDLWNLPLTPAKVNSSGFGISLSFTSPSVSQAISVDYCKISVYWH